MAGVSADRLSLNHCRFLNLYKKKGPSWKEKFYRRCAERLKIAREIEVNRHRSTLSSPLSSSEFNPIRNLMIEELKSLYGELSELEIPGYEETEIWEEIENEFRYDEELIKQELEKLSLEKADEINSYLEISSILCPVCQKAHLTRSGSLISCLCGAEIHNDKLSLSDLQLQLMDKVEKHRSLCDLNLNFACKSGQLVISCLNCNFYNTIT